MLKMFNKTQRAASRQLSLGEAISFLTKFGFIVEISPSSRLLEQSYPQLQSAKDKYYIVPSQLPENLQDGSLILQKGFDWSIHFVFLAGFVPTPVFHNLVAACITWNATRKQGIAWLTKYEIKMVLNAGQLYFVRLCEEKRSIQLDIVLENSDKSSAENREQLIGFIQDKLGQICGALVPAAAKPEACVPCPICSLPHIKYSSLVEGQSEFCRRKQTFVEGDWYKSLFSSQDTVVSMAHHDQPKVTTPASKDITGSESSTKDVLIQFAPQLLEVMPMDDAIFIAKLFAADLLPGNLKAEIKSLPTSADKADYFLDRMIFPNLNNDKSNLCTLLALMEKSSNAAVKNVAAEVKCAIS